MVGSVSLAVLVLALLTYLINPSLAVPSDITFIIVVAEIIDIASLFTQVGTECMTQFTTTATAGIPCRPPSTTFVAG